VCAAPAAPSSDHVAVELAKTDMKEPLMQRDEPPTTTHRFITREERELSHCKKCGCAITVLLCSAVSTICICRHIKKD
jgi:hypothetical protein